VILRFYLQLQQSRRNEKTERKKHMAKKSNKVELPKFTVERPSAAADAVGKIYIPKMSVAALAETVKQLADAAAKDAKNGGVGAKFVRGTLTLY